MIILDTDHISILQRQQSDRAELLRVRLKASDERIRTTIVTYEEQMRGWLTQIGRATSSEQRADRYESLLRLTLFYSGWNLLSFNRSAAAEFDRLRKDKVRIGTMDLRIASIALTPGAILLSANSRDFDRVPDLQVENWLSN